MYRGTGSAQNVKFYMKTQKFRLLQHKRILIKALALATRNGGSASPEQRLSTAGHPAPRRRNIQFVND